MGKITLARVLSAEKYDRMIAFIKEGKRESGPKWAGKQDMRQHKHGG